MFASAHHARYSALVEKFGLLNDSVDMSSIAVRVVARWFFRYLYFIIGYRLMTCRMHGFCFLIYTSRMLLSIEIEYASFGSHRNIRYPTWRCVHDFKYLCESLFRLSFRYFANHFVMNV